MDMSASYSCTATNSVGTAVAVTIAVNVLCESWFEISINGYEYNVLCFKIQD